MTEITQVDSKDFIASSRPPCCTCCDGEHQYRGPLCNTEQLEKQMELSSSTRTETSVQATSAALLLKLQNSKSTKVISIRKVIAPVYKDTLTAGVLAVP